jgi:membrane fusion protein, multidrug efflux system
MNLKFCKNMSLTFLAAVFILCALCGCYKRKGRPPPQPPRVTTALIKQQDVPIFIDTIGQAIPPVTVNVRPQVGGKLLKAYIEQGSIVNAGDVLYEIDPRAYQAQLDEAVAQLARDEATLKYAQQTVSRYKKVVEEDFVSLLNFEQFVSNADSASAQVDLDKANIAAAQLNVEFSKVVAPVSGKISFFNVDVGNILAADDPNQITVIRPFSPIDVLFSLPQQHFELIRHEQGDGGEWTFVAILPEKPDTPFEGTTYFIDNQIDQNTGTILLRGRLPNDTRALWPGEFIRVKVLYRMAPQALIVPPSAVLMGKAGPYLYTLDHEQKAVARNVKVLTKTPEYTAIESSELHAGEPAIINGQINVAPGIKVTEVADQTP